MNTEVERLRFAEIGRKIDEARRAKGWARGELAVKSGYDERTIRNVINGVAVREQTLMTICQTLGLSFEAVWTPTTGVSAEVAPANHGAYSKAAMQKYIGGYFAFRRSFGGEHPIIRTYYKFYWNEKTPCLRYSETSILKQNYSQGGKIYLSENTGLMHLLTVFEGSLRLITLTKIKNNEMRGAVLTQSERTMFYQPSVSAILFSKIMETTDESAHTALVGPVKADDPAFPGLDERLRRIENEVIFFAAPPVERVA